MFESETLQFDNARTLQTLYANDPKLLQCLEEKLAVKVTTRDGWLRLEGERPNIEKARRVFRELEQVRQHGIQIRRHEFQYALDAVLGETRQPLGQLVGYRVLTPTRRAPIVPRSEDSLRGHGEGHSSSPPRRAAPNRTVPGDSESSPGWSAFGR